MKTIHFLTIGAALAVVLQLPAGDTVVRKTDVSAAEAASAVRQRQPQQKRQPRPLVALTFNWRLCEDNGDCNRAILTYLGIPEQQHGAIAAALRTSWQTLQAKFVASANIKVIDGVRPVFISGISKEEAAAAAAAIEQKLSSETSRQTAVLVSALFEGDLLRTLCREYKVDYYSDRGGVTIDRAGSEYAGNAPCVMAEYQEDGKPQNQMIPPTRLDGSRFSGLKVRLSPDYIPKSPPSSFHFSMDYKW